MRTTMAKSGLVNSSLNGSRSYGPSTRHERYNVPKWLAYIKLRFAWAAASLLLLVYMLHCVRFFFPRDTREVIFAALGAGALITLGHYARDSWLWGNPPYTTVPGTVYQELSIDGVWTIGVQLDVNQPCNSVMITRMFSTDNGDLKLTPIASSSGNLDVRTVGEGLAPGRYTFWRKYKIKTGEFGQYRVLVSPAECTKGWTNSYQLFSAPFDWRNLSER